MWGKWAQNQNKTQTSIVDSEKKFYEILKCPATEVTNLIFPNDDVAWVSWKFSENNIAVGKNVQVAVAAYVTTQAPRKLYEYLSKMWESGLYCDRDSVIFFQKDNDLSIIKTGDYLGDLKDELDEYGSCSLLMNVCRVVKNYAFSIFCSSTGKCATK